MLPTEDLFTYVYVLVDDLITAGAIAIPPRTLRNSLLQASSISSATPPTVRNSAIITNIGIVISTLLAVD